MAFHLKDNGQVIHNDPAGILTDKAGVFAFFRQKLKPLLGMDIAAEGPFSKNYRGSYLINYRYSTLSVLSKMPDLPDQSINNKVNFNSLKNLIDVFDYSTNIHPCSLYMIPPNSDKHGKDEKTIIKNAK